MDDTGVTVRRNQQQLQYLQTPAFSKSFGGSGASRLLRDSSGECVSSSEDEHLAGETLFEARVDVHSRKKSSKGQPVHFDQDPSNRVLQLQGDQLKLKKKDKIKAKIFVYYVWVRRNVSDYVPSDSHRIKDESLAVLAGWHTDLMIVTFGTSSEKERFLLAFQKVNLETLRRLYGDDAEPSEQCQVSLASCIQVYVDPPSPSSGGADAASSSGAAVQTLTVKPYETANDVARKCKTAFKLDASFRAQLCLEGSSGNHCMVGCESIFAAVLYHIHEQHKSERRRGSVMSEASSTSPNESNSMDLDVEQPTACRVRLSLHSQDACSAGVCSTNKKKKHQHQQQQQQQSRRASEVPSKIRNWISSNRRSQLVRQASVEALTVSGGGSSGGIGGGGSSSGEPSPIIGRPLAELFPSGVVSRPVTCLLAQIYHRCYATKGIFRQPGSVSEKNQVLQLLSQYDLSKPDNLPQLNSFGDYCIGDALKHYLRNLPGCLLQRNLFGQWSRIGRDVVDGVLSSKAASDEIRSVIQQMHPQNAHLLHMLMTALRRVASNHEQNQMTPANIGRSVSFSVLEQDQQDINLASMEQDAQRINKLIELLITNFDEIWPDPRQNERALNDFVTHICQTDEHLSSTESLEGVRPTAMDAAEPLSLSSLSKDSGLQLSDQQLDDNRRSAAAAPIDIPERQQPPPYDIAIKRQARSQRSRAPQQQPPQKPQRKPIPPPQLPYQEVTKPPARERPPVPARMNRRPASVGTSGRQPLPAGFDPLAESKSRHPLVSTVASPSVPASASASSASTTTASSSPAARPVRAVPANSLASTAAAATSAAAQHQQQQQLQQLQRQSKFRKRSSSETRLELLGLESSSKHQPSNHQHQHQHHQHHHHQHHRHQPDGDETARHRRQEFDRLSRLHTRDSFDSATVGGRQSRQQQRQLNFSSRHAPMRGPAATAAGAAASRSETNSALSSPRQQQQQQQQPKPRTRLPQPLELRLANQQESLV
ncbi:hypothetical protein BOX15_Mlig007135g1 [Macrostomum lignano]|uniref:Rho-GAP domain-containing protein n=1 Tax=Macrostomum lignano TaxID=282301 RepID=A0A267GRI8_9PLAT|nr:hypothetical protein BOX15_Mlig007135g1 [Macrostomum lignano]